MATARLLWPYLWPHSRKDLQLRIIASFVLVLVAKLVTVGVPFTFKWATDALVATSTGVAQAASAVPISWLVAAPIAGVILYGVSRVVMALIIQVRDGLFAKVAMHAVRQLAMQTFEHMHRLSLRFHLEKKTGGLTRVLERGRVGIEQLSRMFFLQLVPTIIEFLLVCAVLLGEFDWRYVVVLAVMIVAYLYYTVQATNWRMAIRRIMNDSDQDSNGKAIDSLLNYETVKYFSAEKREAGRYDRAMAVYERSSTKSYVSLAVLNGGQAIIFTLGLTVVMAMSAGDVLAGHVSIGSFILVNALMIQLYQPLNFMGTMYREIRQSLVDIDKMFQVLDEYPEIADTPGAKPLQVTGGAIRFDNVVFHYAANRTILRQVSFEVPAGKTVAIVGPSGAGKSTISRILFRFYDIAGGQVTVDGQDIRDVTQVSLRAAIGMVPQDTVLFNDTIRYNIAYGRDGASDADVEEAADKAQIGAFIRSLPEGFATPVGERGLKLSGGEKQRVAIARTILKSPPILILDEATSALDSRTERDIQAALDAVSQNRTTLVIAHRLSTVVNADEILVLDKGVIVERGRHDELVQRAGVYADMWNRQREIAEAEEALKQRIAAEKAAEGEKVA
ncbi:MAG: ABC transporter ATP-binding protein/permease, partial [Hyphomicrobiales bacterium]|nr:ABC transporter ATP-binding protein/permease [Hyphomicrobiales bacterium]